MLDISVIIPVYNTPLNRLGKCIESVLKLKNKFNIEILIIDDGSRCYINEFFKKTFIGEVVYRYKTNGGVSSARNMGLDIAQGKFICFVDADDIIMAEAFENLDKYEDYQMILFDMNVVENNRETLWKALDRNRGDVYKREMLIELLTGNRMNSPCAKLFSTECIKQNKIRFDESLATAEDMNFVVDILECTSKYYYTRKVAYCYQRDDSTRMDRLRRCPDEYYDNMNYLVNIKSRIVEKYRMEEYRGHLIEDKINIAYNYLSDLMVLHLLTETRKHKVSIDIKALDCDGITISKKSSFKYKLITQKRWFLVRFLAFVRMLYLKMKTA